MANTETIQQHHCNLKVCYNMDNCCYVNVYRMYYLAQMFFCVCVFIIRLVLNL